MDARLVVTHSGNFHPDDVCAVAFLKIAGVIKEDTKVVRTLDKEIINSADIVLDIGKEYNPETHRYDHHQPEFTLVREKDQVPYASFGLVVKHFGHLIFENEEELESFDYNFVRFIDGEDNGKYLHQGKIFSFSGQIYKFNPSWDTEPVHKDFDKAFFDAVDFVEFNMRYFIKLGSKALETKRKGDEFIENHLKETNQQNSKVISLSKYVPWRNYVINNCPNALYVIYPHLRGGFAAEGVPVEPGSFTLRASFPKNWAGLSDEELVEVTKVKDARFCHKGRFLIAASSYEGIEQMVQQAMKFYEPGFRKFLFRTVDSFVYKVRSLTRVLHAQANQALDLLRKLN